MGMVLLLGGARSGKSALAARLAVESGSRVTFIATAEAGDDEMAERIRVHRAGRPASWNVIEAPIDLAGAVRSAPSSEFLVIDCLTLWVSNLLLAGATPDGVDRSAREVLAAFAGRTGVVVSNEVGLGIVPANAMARTFRDVLGWVNATFAEGCERTFLMVAGRAIELSGVPIGLEPT